MVPQRMRTALSLASLLVLPLVRACEALRDAVDAGIHLWLDTKEEISPTPHDPTVWHGRHVRFGVGLSRACAPNTSGGGSARTEGGNTQSAK